MKNNRFQSSIQNGILYQRGSRLNIVLSIIVISWNTKEFLRNCLQSIIEQTKDIFSEIIVVDNVSSDGSAEMVECEFPQVRLIRVKEKFRICKSQQSRNLSLNR